MTSETLTGSQLIELQQQTTTRDRPEFKRPATPSTISSQETKNDENFHPNSPELLTTSQNAKQKHKRIKRCNSMENLSVLELMKPTEKHISEATSPYVLNFQQVASLFENAIGSPDAISVIKSYTEDLPALLHMLESIYPFLCRSLKSRCTRLQKKIRKYVQNIGTSQSEDDSDSSFVSEASQQSY